MYLCYIDESGTSDIPGNTSHFVLAGVSLPIWHWKDADREISSIMARYDLDGAELHTAWLARPYLEQRRIQNFESMSRSARRSAVERARTAYLLELQKTKQHKTYKQVRKNYDKTKDYIHLSYNERLELLRDVADCFSGWRYARLFVECIDKVHFDPQRTARSVEEQAFEQVVSRFERFLNNASSTHTSKLHGLLIHDNNQTVALKHTNLMRHFHQHGTLWTRVNHIIETPLFVNSSLTSMVQIADLCSYTFRRYVENKEKDLFSRIFSRVDRSSVYSVGARHYTQQPCSCDICINHS